MNQDSGVLGVERIQEIAKLRATRAMRGFVIVMLFAIILTLFTEIDNALAIVGVSLAIGAYLAVLSYINLQNSQNLSPNYRKLNRVIYKQLAWVTKVFLFFTLLGRLMSFLNPLGPYRDSSYSRPQIFREGVAAAFGIGIFQRNINEANEVEQIFSGQQAQSI